MKMLVDEVHAMSRFYKGVRRHFFVPTLAVTIFSIPLSIFLRGLSIFFQKTSIPKVTQAPPSQVKVTDIRFGCPLLWSQVLAQPNSSRIFVLAFQRSRMDFSHEQVSLINFLLFWTCLQAEGEALLHWPIQLLGTQAFLLSGKAIAT